MEKIHCPKCNGISVKNGFQNKTQRYKCKVCNKRFQVAYMYKAYNSNTNEFIIDLLKEGCGLRSISRILKISKNTVLSRMLKISNAIKVPYFDKQGCKFEVDEMFIKIANGENQNWLIYGIERETKSLIGFVVGGRTKESISQLINKILILPASARL